MAWKVATDFLMDLNLTGGPHKLKEVLHLYVLAGIMGCPQQGTLLQLVVSDLEEM